MRHFKIFGLLMTALLLTLPLMNSHAQSRVDEEIPLTRYANRQLGIETLRPVEWQELQPGVFARRADPLDLTVLLQLVVPDATPDGVLASLQEQLQLSQLPEASDEIETDAFTWATYSVPLEVQNQSLVVDIALAEGDEAIYVVALRVNERFYENVRQHVFEPVVEAFAPLRLEEESDTYTAPDESYSVPVPPAWSLTEPTSAEATAEADSDSSETDATDDVPAYVTLNSPDDGLRVSITTVDDTDAEAAIATAWERISPTYPQNYSESDTFTSEDASQTGGADSVFGVRYTSASPNRVTQALAYTHEETTYVLLIDGTITGAQRYRAELDFILEAFDISAIDDDETDSSVEVTDEATASGG